MSPSPRPTASAEEMAGMKKRYKTQWELLRDRVEANPSEAPKGLTFRKLADQSKGERVKRYDPETGAAFLVNPATGEAEPWPTLGWMIEGTIPQSVVLPMSTAMNMLADPSKPITLEKMRPSYKHGGPPENPLAVTHTFIHADSITFHTLEGDVKYRVLHNPDKYPDPTEHGSHRVDWFYILELEEITNG